MGIDCTFHYFGARSYSCSIVHKQQGHLDHVGVKGTRSSGLCRCKRNKVILIMSVRKEQGHLGLQPIGNVKVPANQQFQIQYIFLFKKIKNKKNKSNVYGGRLC